MIQMKEVKKKSEETRDTLDSHVFLALTCIYITALYRFANHQVVMPPTIIGIFGAPYRK